MTSTINASSVALAERYAREHFGLDLPITSSELKSAFRRKAKELHTDTSGDEGTNSKFIAMKKAYDFLVTLEGMSYVYGEKVEGAEKIQLETTDGTPLYELGLGLGPMKNGRDCERCQRKGYTEHKEHFYNLVCSLCLSNGTVRRYVRCEPCGSTGKFRQRRSGRVVTCRACNGDGMRCVHIECPQCAGGRELEPQTIYSKCYECNGTGEIELFSPLFPKGRIINVKRR